jgi:sugar transferase (PEP-CTERM/EpsH1 system associated)
MQGDESGLPAGSRRLIGSPMEILFLSHCVPNRPDKGEKIRAHHELRHLAREHTVHLACLARTHTEAEEAEALRDRYASVHVEVLDSRIALGRAACRFVAGGCLTGSFYDSPGLRDYVASLERLPLEAAVAYSAVMVPYAPSHLPLLLDMVDVDSEKWFEYGRLRRFGPLYSLEARRYRRLEARCAAAADCTVVSTAQEAELLRSFNSGRTVTLENGVDFDFFDPDRTYAEPALESRRFLLFLGVMNYYPNADAVCRFASEIFPCLRRRDPQLELVVAGRSPSARVERLGRTGGVSVTGYVTDVRPYLAAATAVVAPLRIARGVQNKVLEGLAMRKRVLASSAVCRSFGGELPAGVRRCDSVRDYEEALEALEEVDAIDMRRAAMARFCWATNMKRLSAELENIAVRGSSREGRSSPPR